MPIVYDITGISLRAVTSSFTPVGSDVQLVLDASLVSVVLVLVLIALYSASALLRTIVS